MSGIETGGKRRWADRLDATTRTVLLVSIAALVLMVMVAVLSPKAEDDPTPATWNTGKAGAKAALLLVSALGYQARASEQPLTQVLPALAAGEAARTTLVLANPQLPVNDLKEQRSALHSFLQRGGSVLATGINGAQLLERSGVKPAARLLQTLCLTVPEGASPLARAGSLSIPVSYVWAEEKTPSDPLQEREQTSIRVVQRCGGDAVVVRWPVGAGTATWWSHPMPLSNEGLHDEANLRLLIASLTPDPMMQGDSKPETAVLPGSTDTVTVAHPLLVKKLPAERASSLQAGSRVVLFDESLHGDLGAATPDPLKGLPLPLLSSQAALIAVVMLFSFSRRQGPVRAGAAAGVARSSPLEFAQSIGALYNRAKATRAPVEAAERRLYQALLRNAGLSPATLAAGPTAVSATLRERYGESEQWELLANALKQAAEPSGDGGSSGEMTLADTLATVQALDAQANELPHHIRNYRSMQGKQHEGRMNA